MKIAFVSENFLPDHKAGTEQYILSLSKELISCGHSVWLIIAAVGIIREEYTYEEIKVIPISVPRYISSKEMNGIAPPSTLKQFEQTLLIISPDIVHFHSFSRSFKIDHLKVAHRLAIKTVFTPHLAGIFCVKGNLLLFEKDSCDGRVEKHRCFTCYAKSRGYSGFTAKVLFGATYGPQFFRKFFPSLNIIDSKAKELKELKEYCDWIIAISPWIKNVFSINEITNTSLVLQGTDKPLRSNNYHPKDKVTIGFIGRMYPAKGIHLLLDALTLIDNSSFIVKIAYLPFDDNYLKIVKDKADGLANAGQFYANLSTEEIEDFLNTIDILCLPSIIAEMAPLVILEAFSKGVPVLGSNHGGTKDMIEHNTNGLLFENNNREDLIKSLQRLIEEPNLLQMLHDGIVSPRSFHQVGLEMDKIYQKLLL